jgi:hypothetical protein
MAISPQAAGQRTSILPKAGGSSGWTTRPALCLVGAAG